MKKRRELDALVGGIKARRKTSKSGHELLRYNGGSESSDCDDFNVMTKKARGSGFCSTCTSVFTFLLLVACMLVCAGLTWMHVEMKKDLETIRQGLQAVETKSSGNVEDIQKLYSQLSACNKSLEAETKQLAQVQANVSSINATISKLTEDVARVGASLKSAPELKQLPDKLQTVSKTVADLGSDVTGMKDTVTGLQTSVKQADTKLGELTQQLQLLKLTSDSDGGSDTDISPELANQIQTIQQKLGDVNSTLSTKVSVMMKSLGQHEDRLTQLEDTTEMLKRNLTTVATAHSTISGEHADMADVLTSKEFKTSVQDIVNTAFIQRNFTEAMDHGSLSPSMPLPPPSPSSSSVSSILFELIQRNLTEAMPDQGSSVSPTTRPPLSSSSSVSSILISVKDTIDLIQERYHNLSITVQKNAGDIGDMKATLVPLLRFNTVRDEFQTTLTSLNATLMTLKAQVDKNPVPVTSAPQQSTKTETNAPPATGIENQPTTKAQVTDTAGTALNTTLQQPSTASPSQGTGKPSTKKPTSPNTGAVSTEGPGAENPQTGKTLIATNTEADKTEKPEPTPTPDIGPHLKIQGIETADDLDLNFRRWDRTGSGQVPYNRLEDFLGPKRPAEEELKPFDKDNNDLYSIEEFAKALGITLEDETEIQQDPKTGREG